MRIRTARSRWGATVAELLIAAVIGAILSLAITKLFFSSVRVSQKGMAHLTNIQSAALLVTQIEQDFRRAAGIQPPPPDMPGGLLQITGEDEAGLLTVVYANTTDRKGVLRRLTRVLTTPDAPDQTTGHVYCQGLPVVIDFTPVTISGKTGYSVAMQVKAPGPGGEEVRLKRLFACPNLPENRRQITLDWTFGN